jgi:diaminopimelate decarboxylase
MDYFEYRGGRLYAENVAVSDIVAEVGTPAFIYSERTLLDHYDKIAHAFRELDPLICYSVKSCSNLAVLGVLAAAGAGFDIVSGGELYRVLRAGGRADRTFYAGVGKTDAEIRYALAEGIFMFNIESEAEFANVDRIAGEVGARPRCALRINPDIDPKTHKHTSTGKKESKFGVDIERAEQFFRSAAGARHAQLVGAHLHIGSPIYDPQAYAEAIRKVLPLADRLRADGIAVDTLDLGGGFAASYESGKARPVEDYADVIVPLVRG